MALFILISILAQPSLVEHPLGLYAFHSKVLLASPNESIAAIKGLNNKDYIFTFKLQGNKVEAEKIFEGETLPRKCATFKFVSNREKTKFAYLGPNKRFLFIEKSPDGFQVKCNQILDKPPYAIAFTPDENHMVFGFSSYQEKTDDYVNKLQLVGLPKLSVEEECDFIGKGGFEDMEFVKGLFVVFYSGQISVWDFGKRFEIQHYIQGNKNSFYFHGPLYGDIFHSLNVQADHFGLFNESIWGYYFSFVELKNTKKLAWRWVRPAKHKFSEFLHVIYSDKNIHLESRLDLRGKSEGKKELYILAKNDGSILDTLETQTIHSSGGTSISDRLGKDFVFIVNSSNSRLVWIRNTNAP